MNLYDAVCANIARRHKESKGPVIALKNNEVNNGCNNTFEALEANIHYKVTLENHLRNKEAFVLTVSDATTCKPYPQNVYTVDENDTTSFFIKFSQPVSNCYFLLNQT